MSSSSFSFFGHKSLTIVQAFSFRIDFFGLLFFFISDDVHERFSGKKDIGLYWRQFGVRKTILMQRSSEIELPWTVWCYHCVIDFAIASWMLLISLFSTRNLDYSTGFLVQNRFFQPAVFLHFLMMFLSAFQEKWILVYIGDNTESGERILI